MSSTTDESAKKSEVLQAVVPTALGDEIRKDAEKEDPPSVSTAIRKVLKKHYRARLAKRGVNL